MVNMIFVNKGSSTLSVCLFLVAELSFCQLWDAGWYWPQDRFWMGSHNAHWQMIMIMIEVNFMSSLHILNRSEINLNHVAKAHKQTIKICCGVFLLFMYFQISLCLGTNRMVLQCQHFPALWCTWHRWGQSECVTNHTEKEAWGSRETGLVTSA